MEEQGWQKSVESIVFQDTLDGAPDDAEDLSEEKNRSVLGWNNGSALYLAGEGGVKAPDDCGGLFRVNDAPASADTSGWLRWQRLTQIQNLQLLDTSKVVDMSGMFLGCESLTSLDLSGFDTSRVSDMSNLFTYCENLTSLDLSGFDTSQVTNMKGMFSCCENLTSLDVSSFDTSQVTDMTSMFYCCESLTSLDVSSFDTSQVTDMRYMFRGCYSLTSLNTSGFDTSRVTDMEGMFANCRSLTSLDVSGFDTSQVEEKDDSNFAVGKTQQNHEFRFKNKKAQTLKKVL